MNFIAFAVLLVIAPAVALADLGYGYSSDRYAPVYDNSQQGNYGSYYHPRRPNYYY